MNIWPTLLVMTLSTTSLCSLASEWQKRREIETNVQILFAESKFNDLDVLHAEYLRSQARLPSGIWKLAVFHGSLDIDVNPTDDKTWAEIISLGERWMKDKPKSAAAVIQTANLHSTRGWAFRGTEFANEVKEENWKPFKDQIELARNILEKHREVAKSDPAWYVDMIHVGAIQNWSDAEIERLLEEGAAKYPGYYGIYFAAANAYSPKWGGSEGLVR